MARNKRGKEKEKERRKTKVKERTGSERKREKEEEGGHEKWNIETYLSLSTPFLVCNIASERTPLFFLQQFSFVYCGAIAKEKIRDV